MVVGKPSFELGTTFSEKPREAALGNDVDHVSSMFR